jgi:mannose-6-phosphate isomerase-like protein (cupin superfamily)
MSANDCLPATAVVADLSVLPPVRCPCGWARRAFGEVAGAPASMHRVEVELDARTHYHRTHTEVYYVLECGPGAAVELDGRRVAVRPGSAVLIPPGVRHRAVGRMSILNVVIPPFDPADEHFD